MRRVAMVIFTLIFPLTIVSQELTFPYFTLDEAERIALENNKNIQTLRQLVEKARQGRLESFSKWLPELNLISRGYASQRRLTSTGTHSAFISQFSLTQTVFSSNRYFNVRISNLEVEQLSYLLNAIMIDVLFDVRLAYYQVILDKETIEIAKKNIEIFTKLAERMKKNYEIGTSILLNLNQSKVAIANATSLYYQAVKQLEIDLDILVTTLGFNPGCVHLEFAEHEIPIFSIPEIASKIKIVEEIFEKKYSQSDIYNPGFPESEKRLMKTIFNKDEIYSWESKALEYRPDLHSKHTQYKIADQEVKKQLGTYLPYVFLEANYGGYPERMLDNPSSSFFNQRFHGAIGFNLEWLLYDSCGRNYRINQARYARNAKSIEYDQGVQTTLEDVRKQIFVIKESVSDYVTAEGNVKLAEQTLELANKQLDIGYITVFDYQSVADGLIQALNIRNKSRFDLISGYYGLRHASGIDLTCR